MWAERRSWGEGEGEGHRSPRFAWVMAAGAFFLAVLLLADVVLVPVDRSTHAFPGGTLQGQAAKTASALHTFFLFWLARAFALRKRVVVPATLIYAGGVLATLWLWSTFQGDSTPYSLRTTLITNALVTVLILTVCRTVLARSATFDEP